MKLTKVHDQETTGGVAIPERFKLDVDANAGKNSGGAGATIAVVCSLIGIGLLGATAWLIYQNLALIENV